MKLKDVLLIISSSVILTSCNYLDVVPSEIPQLSDAFKNEATAQNYIMGNVYGYIPTESSIAENPALLSTDELDIPWRNDKTNFKAYHINLGTLDTSSPYFNLWEGANGSKALYKGIREAYVFLENIDQVPDLDVAKKSTLDCRSAFSDRLLPFLPITAIWTDYSSQKQCRYECSGRTTLSPKRTCR